MRPKRMTGAPASASAVGTTMGTLTGAPGFVPVASEKGVPAQPMPERAGAHSTKSHASGGTAPGAVTSQVTVALSPGATEARFSVPGASTRAPTTRVLETSDEGSKSPAQPIVKNVARIAGAQSRMSERRRGVARAALRGACFAARVVAVVVIACVFMFVLLRFRRAGRGSG